MSSKAPSSPSEGSTPEPSATRSGPSRSCKLLGGVLTIRTGAEAVSYRVEELDPHPMCGRPAFCLTKKDGSHYEVILTQWGIECDCADATYRHGNDGKLCKHAAALVAVGLLRA